MRYCIACGNENPNDSSFCMNCGSSLPEPEIRSQVNARVFRQQPNDYRRQGRINPNASYVPYREDKVHPIGYICTCCVPFAGFVIWLVIKDQNPESGNTILLLSIVTLVIAFIMGAGS